MILISTNIYHSTRKYPASSMNVFAANRKRKNQRPFKKGNHNIISIFSLRCLNWHEEYNQINLLTVTRMPLQEREEYRLPAYTSSAKIFFSFYLNLVIFWHVCIHYGAITQVVENLSDQLLLYRQLGTSVGHINTT